jgi:hypothetical protein
METDGERYACFERVLTINPHNPTAGRGIGTLRRTSRVLVPGPVFPSLEVGAAPQTADAPGSDADVQVSTPTLSTLALLGSYIRNL